MCKVTQSVFLCSCIIPTSIPPAVSLHWWLKLFLYVQRVKLCSHVVISLLGLSAGTEPRISRPENISLSYLNSEVSIVSLAGAAVSKALHVLSHWRGQERAAAAQPWENCLWTKQVENTLSVLWISITGEKAQEQSRWCYIWYFF